MRDPDVDAARHAIDHALTEHIGLHGAFALITEAYDKDGRPYLQLVNAAGVAAWTMYGLTAALHAAVKGALMGGYIDDDEDDEV